MLKLRKERARPNPQDVDGRMFKKSHARTV